MLVTMQKKRQQVTIEGSIEVITSITGKDESDNSERSSLKRAVT